MSPAFLEASIESGRGRNSGTGIKLIEDPYCLQVVAEAGYAIKGAILHFLNDCDELMETAEAGASFTVERRAELRYNTARSVQLAAHAVERSFEQGDVRATFLDIRCSTAIRMSRA